jgi:bifunctional DNA-binding transcriptional regulator/antitoxin component of YhaV-PrlF toxin-antitoxin module
MNAFTVTAKGQVTLRKEFLAHLGVAPGDKIAVEKLPDGRLEIKADRRTGKISDSFGMLKREGQPTLTIDEMNEIIQQGWAGEVGDHG